MVIHDNKINNYQILHLNLTFLFVNHLGNEHYIIFSEKQY